MWRKDAAKCAKDATMRTKDVAMCAKDAAMCAKDAAMCVKVAAMCAKDAAMRHAPPPHHQGMLPMCVFFDDRLSSLRRDLVVVLRASDPDHRY